MDRAQYQLQQRAHKAFNVALEERRLTRQPCVICGDPRSDGHHPDYRSPLKVHWLCARHHGRVHTALNRLAKPRAPEQFLTYHGKTLTVREWAARISISPGALTSRIHWRWPLGLALALKPCRRPQAFHHGRIVRATRECLAYLRPRAGKQKAAPADGPQLLLDYEFRK
jgi:hypothetical protein